MGYIQSGKARFPSEVQPLMVPMDSITQYLDNPNNGDVEALIESIKVNGFTTVITVDAASRQIVAGNHRWQALHALGATHIPALFVEYDAEQDARRYLIADNRTGQLARMDDQLLAAHLAELRDHTTLGLFGSGYTEEDYDRLLMEINSEALPDAGGGPGIAVNGIYEVVVTFDNESERDELLADLTDRYGEEQVRMVNT